MDIKHSNYGLTSENVLWKNNPWEGKMNQNENGINESEKRESILLMLFLALVFAFSCTDEVASLGADKGGTINKDGKPSLLQSCKGWGDANLCLLTQEEGRGTVTTPTLTFKGLNKINGNVRLFSDGECSTVLGSSVVASVATVEITAPAQNTFLAEYYAQYTHTDNSISPCLGPVAWTVEETPTLAFESSAFSVPTFTLSELNVQAGSVELFSDSACTVSASDPVVAYSDTHSIAAHTLTSYGSFEYYARHKDIAGQAGNCVGPISYDFVSGLQETDPVLALDSGNDARDDDSTPTIALTSLDFESGKIQLFSDESCTTSASDEADYTYSSLGSTVTANALGTFRSTNYWAKITENIEKQSRCMGPVAYEYVASVQLETLTLALSSTNVSPALDSTPTLSVGGIDFRTGTVQLFSDSSCTTAASSAVAASSASVSITANVLTGSSHQFYVRHTDTDGNKGNCTGPVDYSLETLTLALTSPSVGWGSDDTPTFSVSGLVVQNGTVQLFSDSACSTSASGKVTVSSGTASITTNALIAGNHQFYVQHTDSNSTVGDCIGPAIYSMETLTLALSSPTSPLNSDSTPAFTVSGFVVENGTVQLFSDSACSTSASNTVTVSSGTASITANALTNGNHQFYVQHTDSSNNKGDCVGPLTYSMETLTLALTSPNVGWGSNDTPTFSVSGLLVQNGTVQLYSDSACTTSASNAVTVTSGTASITSNALTAGNHQFYVQHTDSSSNVGDCFGPASYSMETLTFSLSSPSSLNSDSNPIFSVSGLMVHNGTVQLFSDSSCSTSTSDTVTVSSGTASITANALTTGVHQFYVQHTDSSSNKGDCVGPVSYLMEILSLALSSPSTGWGSDDTPTFSVSGLVVFNGTVQLFSDSVCTTAASGKMTVSSGTTSISTNTLTSGNHQFYVQHTDSSNNKGNCFGSVSYSMESLTLELSSPATSPALDSTPTLGVTGLVVQNGTVQLFSDSTCTTSTSGTVAVDSGAAVITANALTGTNHQFYVQHKDSNNNKGDCVGPVAYSLEILTLALSSPATSPSLDSTPTLIVTGLVVQNGTVQLFSDSACTTVASGEITVASGTATITANSLMGMNHKFYVQHTDSSSNKGGCVGPVAYSLETLTLALTSPSVGWGSSNTPTFSVSGLVIQNGTVQLFSDSACSTSASGAVTVSSGTASVTANALTAGNHNFYVQHTDSNSNVGNCFGPVTYSMESLILALSSSNTSLDSDPTPSLSVAGLLVHNGTVQLFSDSTCSTLASGGVAVSSGTASITANALSEGIHNFYVQHTDSNNNKGNCFGPISYRYSTETLALTLASPSTTVGYSLPMLSVTGIEILNGTVRIFDDANCSSAVSDPTDVSSNTASIITNPLGSGSHNFYVRHTDSSNHQGQCFGTVAYEYHEGAKAISTGGHVYGHTCAILNDDSVKCWGTRRTGNRPSMINLYGRTAKSISVGYDTCIVLDNGTLECGSRTINFGNDRTVKSVSGRDDHICAILDNNSLKCWGYNRYGQLGDGTNSDKSSPATVYLGDGRTAKAVSTGDSHTCAILDDNSLKCWGWSLAIGSSGDQNTPVTINLGDGRTAKAVSTGNSHTCAILDDDSLKCWGSGYRGSSPVAINLGSNRTSKAVAAGSSYACAILDNNDLKCWGDNDYGQLGDGASEERNSPVSVDLGTGRTAKAVAAGNDHTCAILDDGSLKCWGKVDNGRLGNGINDDTHEPTSIGLGASRTVQMVDAGKKHTCAVLDDGSLKCWGENRWGQLGDGTRIERHIPTTVNLGNNRIAQSVSSGDTNTCAILDDDSVKCWGLSYGNGLSSISLGASRTAEIISAGDRYTCALLDDDSVKCWSGSRSNPVSIDLGSDHTAQDVGVGKGYACAILENSSVKCWGDNLFGQLGDGSTNDSESPIAVNLGESRTAQSIFVAGYRTCVILDNDAVKCWGVSHGSTPRSINLGTSQTVELIGVGMGTSSQNCIMLDDGSVKCSDSVNDFSRSSVINLGDDRTATSIAVGDDHFCAILDDGSLKCWGGNDHGEVGVVTRHIGDDIGEMGDNLPVVNLD